MCRRRGRFEPHTRSATSGPPEEVEVFARMKVRLIETIELSPQLPGDGEERPRDRLDFLRRCRDRPARALAGEKPAREARCCRERPCRGGIWLAARPDKEA